MNNGGEIVSVQTVMDKVKYQAFLFLLIHAGFFRKDRVFFA